MINKNRDFFQYNSGDLVYIISPLTSQLCTASRKVMIKYVGLVVIYRIIDPHNYLLMTLDSKILRGLFEHKRLKPANIRTNPRKYPKSCTIKTGYKCRTQNLEDWILFIKLPKDKPKIWICS